MRDRGAVIAAKRKRRIDRAKRRTKKELEAHRDLMVRGVRNWGLMLMKAKGEDARLVSALKATSR